DADSNFNSYSNGYGYTDTHTKAHIYAQSDTDAESCANTKAASDTGAAPLEPDTLTVIWLERLRSRPFGIRVYDAAGNVDRNARVRGRVQRAVNLFVASRRTSRYKRNFHEAGRKFSARRRKSLSRSRDLKAWSSFFAANPCMNGRRSTNSVFDFC